MFSLWALLRTASIWVSSLALVLFTLAWVALRGPTSRNFMAAAAAVGRRPAVVVVEDAAVLAVGPGREDLERVVVDPLHRRRRRLVRHGRLAVHPDDALRGVHAGRLVGHRAGGREVAAVRRL